MLDYQSVSFLLNAIEMLGFFHVISHNRHRANHRANAEAANAAIRGRLVFFLPETAKQLK